MGFSNCDGVTLMWGGGGSKSDVSFWGGVFQR